MTRIQKKAAHLASAVLAAVALTGVAAIVLDGSRGDDTPRADASAPAMSPRVLRQHFAVLSRASSNQCGLQATALDKLARHGRLQGACCSRMSFHRYVEQVQSLRRYAHVPEVPRDPYDIPMRLAEQLISYQESIELTPEQQATYERAMKLSDEHGPCCCRCWRWTAFEGQAKYLIARRRFRGEVHRADLGARGRLRRPRTCLGSRLLVEKRPASG